ncbi:MAG TPA: serine protease [Thermoanaerobaculia bacterium]|nr:serine protease [Thermoanaerobaculia bacterium]
MSKAVWRRFLVPSCLVAALAASSAPPAGAAGPFYDEMDMQVVSEGFTAEKQLERQATLSRRLLRELPQIAEQKAIRIQLSADEINGVDKASRKTSPLRIGLVKPMQPIVVSGLDGDSLEKAASGRLVWAAVVRANNAGAIRLHIEDMSLPRNAELFAYSRAGQAYGPYTGTGPDRTGEFWTTTIFGSEAILQLRLNGPVSDEDLRAISFKVREAGVITEGFAGTLGGTKPPMPWEKAYCGNASCIVDATCFTNTPAEPQKLATAKMEWISGRYIYTCTGSLIADNNPTRDNFFLTANHCLSASKAAKNVNFYWRFASSSCNGGCPSNNGWPYITTGSSVVSSNRTADYTLLQLTSNPPAGSVRLGWNSTPIANTNGAALYRVSNPGFGPQVYSAHTVDTTAGTCTGWPRGSWIYSRDITGATDGGSSGSPVLNANSQVVGQLSGGCGFNVNDVCDVQSNATVDGAFAAYYNTIRPYINP